jgi:ADP-ribosyl-[dinitrogen reductase] hydrolase
MQTNELPILHKRYLGALLGLACGDAVGTAVEFSPRGSFEPVTDMLGGGPFSLKAGQWTDDTSMALCLAESLINKKEFDAHDQMNRYLNWWRWGYLSSTGHCFDIGMTTRDALFDFERNQNPFSGSSDPETAGNGSLMRLAPIVLFGFYQKSLLPKLAADSSRTTHGAAEAIESCQLLAELMHGALSGVPKERLLDSIEQRFYQAKIQQLAGGAFRSKTYEQIKGSGYCIESLEAALWCFFHTDSYQAAVLKAVNLGDDADTTGAIVGQLAGAFYGVDAIPKHWRERLAMRDDIEEMATALFLLAQATKH